MLGSERTAGDIQRTERAVLDHEEVLLLKRAAADIQRAAQVVVTIADQRRTLHRAGRIRLPVAGIVGNNRLLDRHRADVADDVVGLFANRAIVVTLDRAGLGRGAVGNRDRAAVLDGSNSRARAAVDRVTVQIERKVLSRCNLDVLGNIVQKRHGLAINLCLDCCCKRFIACAADLRNVLTFLDAVCAVSVFGRNKAIGAVALGDALVERAAGNFKVIVGCFAHGVENRATLAGKRATSYIGFRTITLNNTRDNGSCSSRRRVLNEFTAADCCRTIYQNSASNVVFRCIIRHELTTRNIESTSLFALDSVQAASVCTALNGQRAPVVEHRRTSVASGCGEAFERGRAVVLDVVVACAADNRTVLDRSRRILGNRDGRIACVSVHQRLAAEVEGDVLVDRHILGQVLQQSDSLTFDYRIESLIQRCKRLDGAAGCLENLCNHAGLCGKAAVFVVIDANAFRDEAGSLALSRIIARIKAGKRAAVDNDLCAAVLESRILAVQRPSRRAAREGAAVNDDRTLGGIDHIHLLVVCVGDILGYSKVLECNHAVFCTSPNGHRVLACGAALLHSNDIAVLDENLSVLTVNLEHAVIAVASDSLAIQIDCQVLADNIRRLGRIHIRNQRYGLASFCLGDCLFKCRILGLADLCNVLDRRNRLGLQRDRVLRLPLERVGNRNLVATQVFDSRANRQRSLVLI